MTVIYTGSYWRVTARLSSTGYIVSVGRLNRLEAIKRALELIQRKLDEVQ